LILLRRANSTEGNHLCQFLLLAFRSWNILVFLPYRISLSARSTCPFIWGCAADDGWWWIIKSVQHLINFAHLNWVLLSVRTLLGTSNLYMMLYRNLIGASYVIFTTDITFIHLVNVSIVMNKNLKPPDALGKMSTISILQIAKGQDKSIGQRWFACFIVCFWKN
jgi:hypothetical protein